MTTIERADQMTEQRDALAGRLFESSIAMMDVLSVYLGDRLGLYQALADLETATPAELAAATGTYERYVREWLEQQAVTGFIVVDGAEVGRDPRRYRLPAGHREVLLDRDSLSYLAPLARFTVGLTAPLPALVDAFRTGAGVPYPAYGADAREGQADVNRTQFVNLLGSDWLPAVPDVHARLQADPPARVADIGCGTGWSSIAIARAYPNVLVEGFDADDASIALARRNAAAAGVADRVTFHVRDASDPDLVGRYDLVTFFECVHDFGRPVEALRVARGLLAEGGSAIIADERVAESFAAPGDDVERLMYGWSVLFCLPTGLADAPSVGTGTVMRPETLGRYAAEAGFDEVEVLPIDNDFWRFYRMTR
jgi:SAM-dependent methyltransferase